MIDLGIRAHGPPVEPGPPRPLLFRQLRTAVAVLAVLLVFVAGGSGPPPEPTLVEVAVLPATSTQHQLLAGDRLYAVGFGAEPARRTVTAYDLADGAVRWATPVGTEIGTGSPMDQVMLQVAGDHLLVHAAGETWALDPATGQVRWSVTGLIEQVGTGNVGLVRAPAWWTGGHRPGVYVVLEPASGDVVRRHVVEAGVEDRILLRLVDLDTGAELWASDPAVDGQLLLTDPPSVAVVTPAGAVEVRDARTGAVRHSRPAGPGRPATAVFGVGALLLVRDDSPAVTAYPVDAVRPAWVLPGESWPRPCGAVICAERRGRTSLVEPATGLTLGEVAFDGSLFSQGGHLAALGWYEDGMVGTVDPRTGRPLIDLSAWPERVAAADDAPVVLARPGRSSRQVWFAVLDPGATAVRILGSAPYRSFGCQSSATHIVCRTRSDELRAWRYH